MARQGAYVERHFYVGKRQIGKCLFGHLCNSVGLKSKRC